MIKAVIYDIDDTLYDFNSLLKPATQALYQEASRLLGIPQEAFAKAFADTLVQVRQNVPQQILDVAPANVQVSVEHNRMIRIGLALNQLGLPLFPYTTKLYDTFWNYLLDRLVPEPHLSETAAELKRRGYVLGIGSNMTARIQFLKVEKSGIGPYVDFMVVSEETVVDKPDPRFYALVVKKACGILSRQNGTTCSASQCLFVGDNYRLDFEGARGAGLKALWYDRIEKPWNSVTPQQKETAIAEKAVITDHREIFSYLDREKEESR